MPTHQDIDARSLAMHRLAAEKIRRDPALLHQVQQTLARWRVTVCASSQPYLQEWDDLARQGLDALLAAAVEDSPQGAARRQASPFAGVLSNQERFDLLKQWRQQPRLQDQGQHHAAP